MNNESKKKKRNKKREDVIMDVVDTEQQTKEKPTIDYKQYIKPELLALTSQMKLKPLIEIISKAAQLEGDKANSAQLYELYRTVQNQKIQSQIEIIQTKVELVHLEKDKQTAKEKHDAVLKQAQDKDKFQQMLVDKGNKLNQEKIDFIQSANDSRTNLIKDAEEYAQNLQKIQEDSLPERGILIEENNRLKKEIEYYLLECMRMKEDFDSTIKKNQKNFEDLTQKGKGGFEKVMEKITASAQKNMMENTTLKTEITTYDQKTEELKKIIDMANNEHQKLRDEIKAKKDESILLAFENEEIRSRLRTNKINKEEIRQLLKQYESGKNKLTMMESLNKKYSEQYTKLCQEKNPSIKTEKTCCGPDHQHDHHHSQNNDDGQDQIKLETNEHTHENVHCWNHQQEDKQKLELNNNKFEISNTNKFEISNEVQTQNNKEESKDTTIDSSSQVSDFPKIVDEKTSEVEIKATTEEEDVSKEKHE